MQIAITGCLWDDADFETILHHPAVDGFSKKDYLLVLGRCGIQAPRTDFEKVQDKFRELPFSVLFLGGDKDDYDFLSGFTPRPWNGGLAQTLCRNVIRLCPGQSFSVQGFDILAVGGRSTPDRTDEGKYWDWWPEQDINLEFLLQNVRKKADVIVSADCPSSWKNEEKKTQSSDALEKIKNKIEWNKWFFFDENNDQKKDNYQCVSKDVIRI